MKSLFNPKEVRKSDSNVHAESNLLMLNASFPSCCLRAIVSSLAFSLTIGKNELTLL